MTAEDQRAFPLPRGIFLERSLGEVHPKHDRYRFLIYLEKWGLAASLI